MNLRHFGWRLLHLLVGLAFLHHSQPLVPSLAAFSAGFASPASVFKSKLASGLTTSSFLSFCAVFDILSRGCIISGTAIMAWLSSKIENTVSFEVVRGKNFSKLKFTQLSPFSGLTQPLVRANQVSGVEVTFLMVFLGFLFFTVHH